MKAAALVIFSTATLVASACPGSPPATSTAPAASPEPAAPATGAKSVDYDAQIKTIRALRDDTSLSSVDSLLDLGTPPTDSRVRVEAADALWSKASAGWIDGWKSEDAVALRKHLESAAVQGRLTAMMKDDSEDVRLATVKLLGQLRGESAASLLTAASTGDASEEVRARAKEALEAAGP